MCVSGIGTTLVSLPLCMNLLVVLVQEVSATIALISVVSHFFFTLKVINDDVFRINFHPSSS